MMQRLLKPLTALRGLAVAVSSATLVGPFVAIAPALAQDVPLTERPSYVSQCRGVNRTTEVFNNSSLSPATSRVGTLAAGTEITLTGVLREGRAQVYLPTDNDLIQVLGWVDAGDLGPCDDDGDDGSVTDLCYRADVALIVRDRPTTASPIVDGYQTGETIYPTTNPPTQRTSPPGSPDFGRVWLEVAPTPNTDGWISRTGTGGFGSNITRLPASACQR